MMTATIPNQDYKPLNDFLILWFKDLSLTVKKFRIDKHLQLKGWETSLWLLLKFQNKLGKGSIQVKESTNKRQKNNENH